MNRPRIEVIICAVLLGIIFVLSLTLRSAVPWSHVFSGQWIKLTDNDAYYYMRLLDNLSAHFPLLGSFDSYGLFPSGTDLSGQRPFFIQFMGFFTWLLGGTAPSQNTVDLVGVFFPAVLGALLVFPVFLIGRAVFNKWAGLAAALFIALIPGEFLARTLMGNTDIHALEIFFSTLFILFLILAAQSSKGISLFPFVRNNLSRFVKPCIYSLAAGIFLGLYLLSWEGALFFVFISFIWLVLQTIINHLRGLPSDYLGMIGAVFYVVALLISFSMPAARTVQLSLGIAAIAAVALPLLSWLMAKRNIQAGYYPPAVLCLAVLGMLGIYLLSPQLLLTMFNLMAGFFGWNPASTIAESQPLLINQGAFTLALTWGNYTAGSILALIGLAIVAYRVIKEGADGVTVLAVWSIMTLLAALALRRFAYYFAVNVALLSGFTCWLILQASGLKATAPEAATVTPARKKSKGRTAIKKSSSQGKSPALTALGVAAVALLAIYPNTGPLPGGDRPFFDVATKALYAPSNAWCETLNWMRSNTPEPFGDPQYYYRRETAGSSGQTSTRAAYGVLCWWDYGYWVTRIAHRVPMSNPGTAQLGEQYFFTAPDMQQAAKSGRLNGANYVLLNDYLVQWNGGFPIVATDAQYPASKYFEIYYRQQNGSLSPTLVYYPEYYQTMAVRLYCFDGKQFTPKETAMMSWEERTGADGRPYKEITALKMAPNYESALFLVNTSKGVNWRIIGKDPNVSPVPLEELPDFRLAYSSSQKVKIGTAETSEVKLFEYTGTAGR